MIGLQGVKKAIIMEVFMKANRLTFLVLFLLISLVSSSITASADASVEQNESHSLEAFSLDKIDSSLTLSEVLTKYPEVCNIYFIEKVSEEEALEGIRKGITVINGDDCLGKAFLSSLNGRRNDEKDDNHRFSIQSSNNMRGPYGAALPYISKTGVRPNCYGYVIGVDSKQNPGYYSNLGEISPGATLNEIITAVAADMGQGFEGGGRQIASNTASIAFYEWRIAFRIGMHYIYNGGSYYYVWDYHFWRQTSTGTWCHKPGANPSVHFGYVTPHTANWNLGGYTNFYDSNTIYMAITIN